MFSFDMRTVVLNIVVSTALCTLVIYFLWLQNRKSSVAFEIWLAAYILLLVSQLLLVLRGIIPEDLSIVLVNPFTFAGMVLTYIGVEYFVGKAASQRLNFYTWLTLSLANLYFSIIQPSLTSRGIVFSLGMLLISSRALLLFQRGVQPRVSRAARVLMLAFGGFCLVALVRIANDLIHPGGYDFYNAGLVLTLLMIMYGMLLVASTFGIRTFA